MRWLTIAITHPLNGRVAAFSPEGLITGLFKAHYQALNYFERIEIHAEYSQPVVVHGVELVRKDSPIAGISRKMFAIISDGAEGFFLAMAKSFRLKLEYNRDLVRQWQRRLKRETAGIKIKLSM